LTLSAAQYPSEAEARRAIERLLIKLNAQPPSSSSIAEPIFGALIDRFIAAERLLEIRDQDPGPTMIEGLQYSTACSYLTILERHIRPRWGQCPICQVRSWAVLDWLTALKAAPKYKGKIKALLHRLFEKAMLWEMIELQRNPMTLVEVRGISKRRKKPFVLTIGQYFCCSINCRNRTVRWQSWPNRPGCESARFWHSNGETSISSTSPCE